MHASMIAVEWSIPSSFSNQFLVWLSVFSAYGNINELEWDEKVIEQRRQATGDDFEEDIKSAFSLIDKDADGVITTSDIYELMMGLGEMMTDEEIAEFIKTADLDNDGQINYRGKSQSNTLDSKYRETCNWYLYEPVLEQFRKFSENPNNCMVKIM